MNNNSFYAQSRRTRGVVTRILLAAAAILGGGVMILAAALAFRGGDTLFELEGPEPATSMTLDSSASRLGVCRALVVSARRGDRGSFSVYGTSPVERIVALDIGPVEDSAFVPGKDWAVVTTVNTVRLVELRLGDEVWKQSIRDARLATVAVLADQEIVLTYDKTYNGDIHLLSLVDGRPLGVRNHSNCRALLATDSGDWYSIGGGILRRWHGMEANPVAEIALPASGTVQHVMQLQSGDLLVGGSGRTLEIRDAADLELKTTVELAPEGRWWPVLSSDAGSFIVVTYRFVYRISTADGEVMARTELAVKPTSVPPLLFKDSVVIAYEAGRGKQAVGLFQTP